MFKRIRIVGRGRVGAAVAARLRDRGADLETDRPELVLLCVPDAAIHAAAADVAVGPWIAHVSGATPLAALSPHALRFGLHPLQTFTKRRGAEQLDGAWAAVTAEDGDARLRGHWLAGQLGLRAFDLPERSRVLYHAGGTIAANYLVTLFRAASRLLEIAGAPPEALVPLMRRTIENGFELTGPLARGDWTTVAAHREAIAGSRPELDHLYETLAGATLALAT